MRPMTIIPWALWALIIVIAIWATHAAAEPIYQAEAEGVRIVIYQEDCKLKDVVANLPKRATWHEKGKVYEGCAGGHQVFPIIMAYFVDKTVVALAVEMFRPVRGA